MSARLLGKTLYAAGLALWIVVSFVVGQTLAALAMWYAPANINDSVDTTILAALGYLFALLLAIGVPAAIRRRRVVTLKTLGIHRLPSWSDIGLGILSILPYYIISAVVLYIGMDVLKAIDPEVGQAIPFENLTLRIEYVVAFITLVVIAPIAEELLFRGLFLGKLSERTGKWLAVIVTALVFGFMHLIAPTDTGIVLQWSAAADTFAMGLTAGILQVLSGSIWAGVILHSIKNGIAYYFLFINPLPPGSM